MVVALSAVPAGKRGYFGGDDCVVCAFLRHRLQYLARQFAQALGFVTEAADVLCANVVALAVELGRVVRDEED